MSGFQKMFDKMLADYERNNPDQRDPAPPVMAARHPKFQELPPVDPAVLSAHVLYAFNPRQGPSSNGSYHLILDQPLDAGRLHRKTGDALCKPRSKFWGLEQGDNRARANCPACLRLADRYGIAIRAVT